MFPVIYMILCGFLQVSQLPVSGCWVGELCFPMGYDILDETINIIISNSKI